MARNWKEFPPNPIHGGGTGYSDQEAYFIVKYPNTEGFWVTSDLPKDGREKDIGPFDTFEAAAACFETVIHIKGESS